MLQVRKRWQERLRKINKESVAEERRGNEDEKDKEIEKKIKPKQKGSKNG